MIIPNKKCQQPIKRQQHGIFKTIQTELKPQKRIIRFCAPGKNQSQELFGECENGKQFAFAHCFRVRVSMRIIRLFLDDANNDNGGDDE